MGDKIFSSRALNAALNKLKGESITIGDDGTLITRAERLAQLLWDLALGHTEKYRDEEGNWKERYHPPVSWAMQYVFERLEGKAIPAMPEQQDGMRAADRVRELAKDRLNARARALAGPPKHIPKNT